LRLFQGCTRGYYCLSKGASLISEKFRIFEFELKDDGKHVVVVFSTGSPMECYASPENRLEAWCFKRTDVIGLLDDKCRRIDDKLSAELVKLIGAPMLKKLGSQHTIHPAAPVRFAATRQPPGVDDGHRLIMMLDVEKLLRDKRIIMSAKEYCALHQFPAPEGYLYHGTPGREGEDACTGLPQFCFTTTAQEFAARYCTRSFSPVGENARLLRFPLDENATLVIDLQSVLGRLMSSFNAEIPANLISAMKRNGVLAYIAKMFPQVSFLCLSWQSNSEFVNMNYLKATAFAPLDERGRLLDFKNI